MNLAETASIFFETVVGDTLIDKAPTPDEKMQYRWYDAESAVAFLLNIPARCVCIYVCVCVCGCMYAHVHICAISLV